MPLLPLTFYRDRPGGPVDQAIAAIEFGLWRRVARRQRRRRVRASHAQTGVGNISDSHGRASGTRSGGDRGDRSIATASTNHTLHERYFKMLRDYLFDFGDSLFPAAHPY